MEERETDGAVHNESVRFIEIFYSQFRTVLFPLRVRHLRVSPHGLSPQTLHVFSETHLLAMSPMALLLRQGVGGTFRLPRSI